MANIKNPVTVIQSQKFKQIVDRSITEITAEDLAGITSIGDYGFAGCNQLISIAIPNSIISFGYATFYGCNKLASIIIPDSITSIGSSAFQNCSSLLSIIIPNSISRIENSTFGGCTGLTSITIGNGVTSIGNNAFNNCRSLTGVTILAVTPPTLLNVNAFDSTNNCPIYVPAASVTAYQSATNWSSLASRIQAIPS